MHACGAARLQRGGSRGEIHRAKRVINLQIRAKDGMYYAINYCPLLGTGSICIGFFGMQVIRGGWQRMTSLPELSVWRGVVYKKKKKKKERARFPNSDLEPGVSAIQPYIISLIFISFVFFFFFSSLLLRLFFSLGQLCCQRLHTFCFSM